MPRGLIRKSQKWICVLEEEPTIKVPSCLRFGPKEVVLSETLHTFIKASQDAYSVVIHLMDYLRWWISIKWTSCRQKELHYLR